MTVYSDALRWRAMRALPRDLNSKLYVMCMQALQECEEGGVPDDALPLLNIAEKSFYALADRAGVDRRYKYRVYRAFKGLPFTGAEARRAEQATAREIARAQRRAEHVAPQREDGTVVIPAVAITARALRTPALYRWYDEQDRLLYIGITDELTGRVSSHIDGSSWMDFAASSTITRYKDRSEAATAEIEAIKAEHPLFNQQHNNTPEARRRLVEYLIERDRLDLLTPAVSRG